MFTNSMTKQVKQRTERPNVERLPLILNLKLAIFKIGNGEPGNQGTGEQGNRGTGEPGNRGTGEQGNRGTGELRNRGTRKPGNKGIALFTLNTLYSAKTLPPFPF